MDATARLAAPGGIVTPRFADYVETLLRNLYPHADVIVTPEADGVYLEVYLASFSLHAGIAQGSAMLAVFEQMLLEACAAES